MTCVLVVFLVEHGVQHGRGCAQDRDRNARRDGIVGQLPFAKARTGGESVRFVEPECLSAAHGGTTAGRGDTAPWGIAVLGDNGSVHVCPAGIGDQDLGAHVTRPRECTGGDVVELGFVIGHLERDVHIAMESLRPALLAQGALVVVDDAGDPGEVTPDRQDVRDREGDRGNHQVHDHLGGEAIHVDGAEIEHDVGDPASDEVGHAETGDRTDQLDDAVPHPPLTREQLLAAHLRLCHVCSSVDLGLP